MKYLQGMAVSLAVVTFSACLSAQSSSTCTTAPKSITALDIERVVQLNDVFTTLTPNAPASVLAAIAAGAQEIREHLTYNPQLSTITSTIFLVAPGSPIPTNLQTTNVQPTTIQVTIIGVSQILTSCTPTPALMLVGTIAPSPTGIFGNFTGAPASVSLGWVPGTTNTINNVIINVAGSAGIYSPTAAGTLTFPATGGGGGGGGGGTGTGPAIVVKYGNGTIAQQNSSAQLFSNPLILDASGTTGTAPLTFKWTSSPAGATFTQGSSPAISSVAFLNSGDYKLTLTVTDSAGNTSTFSLTVEYLGRGQ